MRRATTTDDRPSGASTHRFTGVDDAHPGDEERRQRWIAETNAAFLASGSTEAAPTGPPLRRAFRRAALTDEQVPSRRDRWASELTAAFGPTAD